MKKITAFLVSCILFLGVVPCQMTLAQGAEAAYTETTGTEEETSLTGNDFKFEFGFWGTENYNKIVYSEDTSSMQWYQDFVCENMTAQSGVLRVSSSNTKVIKITSPTEITLQAGKGKAGNIIYQVVGVGKADIVVTFGSNTYKMRVYVVPGKIPINSITQTGYQSVTLKWKKISGCSGYRIERTKTGKNDYKVLKTVKGENNTSITAESKWNTKYTYRVTGFVEDEGTIMEKTDSLWDTKEFATKKIGAKIASVKKSGSSSLLIKWNVMKGATGYKLYRADRENGSYKCVYKATKGSKTSYKQKVKQGVTYYYKLVTVYPEGESDSSIAVSQFIPKKGKTQKVTNKKISQRFSGNGQYGWNWADSDDTYYYQADGKLNIVCVQNNKTLKIYTMDSAMKVKKTKTIKLNYDVWGGFYQGPDGNFYVAVGYNNFKESKNKVVIKVIKYNSKWKKVKTASIKGGVSNSFVGIYSPFEAGNCRMDMQGNTLYLLTSRKMFIHADGLRHQSNISFKIDTKTMKAKEANDSYVSHSFNQFVKFKDGNLYVLDHGDAYPRSLHLAIVDNYGTKEQEKKTATLFSLKGKTGENYTGCKVGGMEIGAKNVLVCGTSKPHKYKIKGVSGYSSELKDNVYLVVTNRQTGKATVKWLTNYNPKTTSVSVGETRMVKLSDDRFAILYSTTKGKTSQLHYVVVSGAGKKVYSKTYSNMSFCGDSQPILINGKIVWMETGYREGSYNEVDTKIFSIPAVY